MNKLLRALLDFDWGHFEINDKGQMTVFWIHPHDRKHDRIFDKKAIHMLIAKGFVTVEKDGRLWPTERGFILILKYRPNYMRQPAPYPNYKNWLNNCKYVQKEF